MKQIIGWLLLATPVVALYIYMFAVSSWESVLWSLAAAVLVIGWACLAVYMMITGGEGKGGNGEQT